MNGKIIPHTPIAVDCWQLRKCSHVRLFFLTHMHADHTCGLTSTWNHRPIFCSPLTAKLLKHKLQVNEKWIHALEIGEPHMLPLDDIGKEKLTVTLLDANHCPGAVMFFFEGYFGTILYTGDFRYTPSMLREPCLRNNTTIDVLYLDNTNCDQTRAIPSRQRACQQIKEIIRSHPNCTVVIGLYSLGKESLLVQLALEFKTWVEVSLERLETLRLLDLPNVFSTEPGSGRLRAVSQSAISASNLLAWNKEHLTIAILPTSRPIVSCHPNVYIVPYSDHSSYQELEDFVSALRPVSLVPIVGSCMPYFSSLLCKRRNQNMVVVPESVQRYMRPKSTIQPFIFRTVGLPQRCLRQAPRGVMFESPGKKPRLSSHEDGNWNTSKGNNNTTESNPETDEESDCVLLDMSMDPDYSPNRDPSKNVINFDRLPLENGDILLAHKETRSTCTECADTTSCFSYDCVYSQSHKKQSKTISPTVGHTNARLRTSSMDSNNHQDNSCVTASSSVIPPKLHPESYMDDLEQWLLRNFTIPKDEFTGQHGIFQGLYECYPLAPVNIPKAEGDPFEAAIQKLKGK